MMRPGIARTCFLAAVVFSAAPVWNECGAAEDNPSRDAQREGGAPAALSPVGQTLSERLARTLPEGSEAREMYLYILKGSQLGPRDGWFKLAVSQTRFGWARTAQDYDTNGDGVVTREEFANDADFAPLDHNADGQMTEADFDWSEHALARPPGAMVFYQADRDGNGMVTREEFDALFTELDADGQGFLALDDLRNRFTPAEFESSQRKRRDRPSAETLLKALESQEIGSLQPGPALDDAVPDFTLSTLDGRKVTLSEETGAQPIVLVFGNFTCGPFRSQAGNVERLYRRYHDRTKFFLVYVRESHPKDGWWMESNRGIGIDIVQPTTDAERLAVAQRCSSHLDLSLPMLVDTIDDRVGAEYSGMPSRLYLIDANGKVAFKSGRGPFGFKPAELEQALVLLLNGK